MRQTRTHQQWQQLLADFQTSGLSVSAFCTRQQLSESSFYKWRSRCLSPQSQPETAPRTALAPTQCQLPTTDDTPFINLGTLQPSPDSHAPRRHLRLRLDLGDGLILQLDRD